MKIPEKYFHFLTFKQSEDTDIWYKIVGLFNDRSTYYLYKQIDNNNFELLGTSNNPLKLEEKVYEGKFC